MMQGRTRKVGIILGAITGLGLFLRLYGLHSRPLWYDDITCLAVAGKSLKFILAQYPVYKAGHILLLKAWTYIFGAEPLFIRMLPVLAGTVSIWLVFLLGKELHSRRAGLVSALFLSISCFHIYLSREVKQYTILLALSLAALYFLLRFLKQGLRPSLAWCCLFNAAALFTHPFGASILLVQAAYVLFNRRLILEERFKVWLKSQEVMLVVVGAWGGIILSTKNHLQAVLWWVGRPDFQTLADTYRTFCYGLPKYGLDDINAAFLPVYISWGLAAIFGVLFVRGLFLLLANRRKNHSGIIVFWFFLPIALAWAFSWLVFPVYAIKHLLLILPAFYLIVAVGLCHRAKERLIFIGLAVILAMHIPAWRSMFNSSPGVQWDRAVSLMKEKGIQKNDTFILATTKENICLVYFLDNGNIKSLKDVGIFGRLGPGGWQDTFQYGEHRIITFGSEIPGVIRPGYQPMRFTDAEFQRKVIKQALLDRHKGVWLLVSKWASGERKRDQFAAGCAQKLAADFSLLFENEAGGIKLYYFAPQEVR